MASSVEVHAHDESGDASGLILFVEPFAELRETRLRLLLRFGLTVHLAENYGEASRQVEQKEIALAVIDAVPGPLTAADVAAQARRRWAKAKILLLTESPDVFEDTVFDESVNPAYNPSGLIQAAERLLAWYRTGRMDGADTRPVTRELSGPAPWLHGLVVWFNSAKGYGFLSNASGGPDVFCHFSSIEGKGYKSLLQGQRVEYQLVDSPQGKPQAAHVRRAN